MLDLGNEAAAAIFATLARFETEHLMALELRTEGVTLPQIPLDDYRWLGAAAPETVAREFVFRLMSPRDALAIALGAEKRAQAFFEWALITTPDPALRVLAREMAAEESEHIAMLERVLAELPDPVIDWESHYQER
jgi:rubrerythrin